MVLNILLKELDYLIKNRSILPQLFFLLIFSILFPLLFSYSIIVYKRATFDEVYVLIELGKYYPLMISALFASIFAGESFAGERERKTIEILAATPLSARSIFLGKLIFSLLLALLLYIPVFVSFTFSIRYLIEELALNIVFPTTGYLVTSVLFSLSLTVFTIIIVVVASLCMRTKSAATSSALIVLLPIALLITSTSLLGLTINEDLIMRFSFLLITVSIISILLLSKFLRKELIILGLVKGG